MPRGRPRTRFCDCGEHVRILGRRLICARCLDLDGHNKTEQYVLGELRDGAYTLREIARGSGFAVTGIAAALRALVKRGRVVVCDGYYRLGDHAWDTSPLVDYERGSGVLFPWLEDRPLLPADFHWEGGHVVSGPLRAAKFPGRRFPTKKESREYYSSRFTITAECRLHPDRYIYQVTADTTGR